MLELCKEHHSKSTGHHGNCCGGPCVNSRPETGCPNLKDIMCSIQYGTVFISNYRLSNKPLVDVRTIFLSEYFIVKMNYIL